VENTDSLPRPWKRGFHHGEHDAEYMTAFVPSSQKVLGAKGGSVYAATPDWNTPGIAQTEALPGFLCAGRHP